MMRNRTGRAGHNGAMLDDSLREATDVVGDRWVLLALGALNGGARRFGDLQADLAGIAPNVLTDRLRRMERDGLVVATPYTLRPRRYVYDLTEAGRELADLLPMLAAWASRRRGDEPMRHDACGTPVRAALWCEHCATAVDDVRNLDVRWV
jgi:DNA-binding HxlR family transcriptional regulator